MQDVHLTETMVHFNRERVPERVVHAYVSLPVNQARCPVHSYHRDGHMRFDDNGGEAPNYEPNSLGGPVQDPGVKEPPLRISGSEASPVPSISAEATR